MFKQRDQYVIGARKEQNPSYDFLKVSPFCKKTVIDREKCIGTKVVENLIPDHENVIRFEIRPTVSMLEANTLVMHQHCLCRYFETRPPLFSERKFYFQYFPTGYIQNTKSILTFMFIYNI